MAFTFKFVYFILILLFSLALLTQTPSEWNCGHGCFYAEAAAQVIPNRKVLHGSIMHGKEDAVSESAKVQGSATSTTRYGGGSENWELRRVPAGPDPLHHHGGSPKKPTTP